MKLHELQILLFNCMPQRDPRLLLPRLLNTCSDHGNPWSTPSLDLKMQILSRTAARLALFWHCVSGVHFHKAIFVPSQSAFNQVGSHSPPADGPPVDLSWQRTLQRAWESLHGGDKGTALLLHMHGYPVHGSARFAADKKVSHFCFMCVPNDRTFPV